MDVERELIILRVAHKTACAYENGTTMLYAVAMLGLVTRKSCVCARVVTRPIGRHRKRCC